MAETVAELIDRARGSEDWRSRRLAVIGLGYRQGAEILPVLLACLEDPVSDVRHAAIIALGRRGDRQAVEELQRPKILASPDAQIRWAAVSALGKLGDHRTIDPLVELVEDPEWLVSNEALVVLRTKVAEIVVARDLKLARPLVRLLNIPDPEIVALAKEGLHSLGAAAAPMLRDALVGVWEPVRRHAAGVLGEIGDPGSVPALIRALADPSPAVRGEVAGALGRIGAVDALRPLIAAMGDFDDRVRKNVVAALVRYGRSATEPLGIALDHTRDKRAKCAAIEALGRIGDARAIPILCRHLGSGYHLVRAAAVVSLTRFGEAVVTPLSEMLSYHRSDISQLEREVAAAPDPGTRLRAVKALGDLEDHRAVLLLKSLLSAPERGLALAAQTSLEKIGCAAWGRRGAATVLGLVGDRSVVPAVLALLEDDSINVRRAALHALGGLEAREHGGRLVAVARQDPEPQVRRAALSVLRELAPGSGELFEVALEALADVATDVRVRATRIVAEFPDQRAVQPLIERLSDSSWNVRISAESALCTQGRSVVPGLLQVLARGSLLARRRAVSALGRIGDEQAIGPIEALLEREQDPGTQALARDALRLLREGGA